MSGYNVLMIPRSAVGKNGPIEIIESEEELFQQNGDREGIKLAPSSYPMRVPQEYLQRADWQHPADPLLLQSLPDPRENQFHPDFVEDPVGDINATIFPGVIHKYHGRILVVLTRECAIHCRFCFRRNYIYDDGVFSINDLPRLKEYLQNHPEITELILSGGDPLMASKRMLKAIRSSLGELPQLKRLRIHSRIPIVWPKSIKGWRLEWLLSLSIPLTLVVHCNHPQELAPTHQRLFKQLTKGNITLLNQSVLLKGVNDSVDTLVQLSESLFSHGILPYYLHLLDKAKGTAHFQVKRDVTATIITDLKKRLPGYLVPKVVEEIAGDPHKRDFIP